MSAVANRQLLHGTCLFTDAEEYTTVSEALRPEELAGLMNDYYQAMFRVVERHGGMVSDTSGDSMVALWATTTPDSTSRIKACRAALEIVEAVAEFNLGRGGSQLPTRVGLESGEVLLGNIGAEQRFEYRAIGDHIVNTASRLQGLNRLLRTRVLVSAATVAGAPGLVTRNVGVFLLRGKKRRFACTSRSVSLTPCAAKRRSSPLRSPPHWISSRRSAGPTRGVRSLTSSNASQRTVRPRTT